MGDGTFEAMMFDSTLNRVTLCVRFTVEFPLSPPEVWLRRPRMRYRTGTGGGGTGRESGFWYLEVWDRCWFRCGMWDGTLYMFNCQNCQNWTMERCKVFLFQGRGPQMGKFALSLPEVLN